MEHLEAHFINRYRILINKGHLLFTEHQKFWKSIKNPSQKVKKCEIFSRFWKNVLIYIVNVLIYIVNTKGNQYKSMQIIIITEKNGKYFTFFQFSQWFFYDFSKFWMFWKEESLLSKSGFISIYEICSPSSLHGCLVKTYKKCWF